MAFQYTDPGQPYAGSIASLMLRRGDVDAAGAQNRAQLAGQAGAIQAQGELARGQALGDAIQGAGNTIAAIPGQMIAARSAEQRATAERYQVEALKRQSDDLKALDAAYAGGGGREQVINALPGHLRGQVAKDFEAFDKAHGEAQKLREEADRLATESIADLGGKVRDYGYDPTAAQLALSEAKAKYGNDPQRLQQIQALEAQLHDDPTPETVKKLVDPLINLSPKRREEALKLTEEQNKKAIADVRATETARHDREVERISALTEGRAEAQQRETARHNGAIESIERGNSAIASRNAATNAAREAREGKIYDQTYGAGGTNPDGTPKAPVISPTAKAIAEYRMPAISPRAAASGPGKALMDQVMAYNPSYDAAQFPKRNQITKDYSPGGKIGTQLGSLNTAIEHLGILQDMSEALGNGSFTPGNELYNRVRTIFGSDAATNFNFARDIMSGELATAMKKSGATDTEIDKVTRSLSSAGSPEQLAGAIRTVAIPMIAGKAQVLDEQYHAPQAMGEKDPYSVYTPGAKAVLERIKGKPQAAAAPAVGSTVTYQGKQYKIVSIENGQAKLEPIEKK